MDQDAYRTTYHQINDRFCLFEKCLFAGYAGCAQADRFNLAEREGIHCKSDSAQARCGEFLDLLRQHSRFILKTSDTCEALSHAQALRLQVGGIRGVAQVMTDHAPQSVTTENIHALLNEATERYNALDQLPFSEIMQQVAAFKGRRR